MPVGPSPPRSELDLPHEKAEQEGRTGQGLSHATAQAEPVERNFFLGSLAVAVIMQNTAKFHAKIGLNSRPDFNVSSPL